MEGLIVLVVFRILLAFVSFVVERVLVVVVIIILTFVKRLWLVALYTNCGILDLDHMVLADQMLADGARMDNLIAAST